MTRKKIFKPQSDILFVYPRRKKSQSRSRRTELFCPPDKSLSHRALFFAALSKHRWVIKNCLDAQDIDATLRLLSALGVRIRTRKKQSKTPIGVKSDLVVQSPGPRSFCEPVTPIDIGNSGTTARLGLGLLAGSSAGHVVLLGDASLSQRPMARVVAPLRLMGADIDGRQHGSLLPLAVRGGPLRSESLSIGIASAQVKSALLLAGVSIEGETTVELPVGSRDHTERCLQRLGADIRMAQSAGSEVINLIGPFEMPGGTFSIPADPSSAAFLITTALLVRQADETPFVLKHIVDNPTRLGFFYSLQRMGVDLAIVSQTRRSKVNYIEDVCDVVLQGERQQLKALQVSASDVPAMIDEVPLLMVLACFADGDSTFQGLSELRVKESDRLAKTIELIRMIGGKVLHRLDDVKVIGRGIRFVPKAFVFDAANDHRMAMLAATVAKAGAGRCKISGAASVNVSFPGFFAELEKI